MLAFIFIITLLTELKQLHFFCFPVVGFLLAGYILMSSSVSFVQEVDVQKLYQSITYFYTVIIKGQSYIWLKYIVMLLEPLNSHQEKTGAPYHIYRHVPSNSYVVLNFLCVCLLCVQQLLTSENCNVERRKQPLRVLWAQAFKEDCYLFKLVSGDKAYDNP